MISRRRSMRSPLVPRRRKRATDLALVRSALPLLAALSAAALCGPLARAAENAPSDADPSPIAGTSIAPSPGAEAPRPGASPIGGAVDLAGLVDVGAAFPGLRVELKYATADNFLGRNVYGDLERCFLVPDAARKLGEALAHLRERAPGLTLLAYDCARPRRVQRAMWALVEGTPEEPYVANPNVPPGSVHNTGCAVDLTLAERSSGRAIDMGTPFDFFGPLAEPARELEFFEHGELSREAFANRLVLREVMVRAGFRPRANEWWHFDCEDAAVARERYPLIE